MDGKCNCNSHLYEYSLSNYVAGSAKTQHNRASLNLQYKANGENLHVIKIFECFVLSEERA